MSGSIAHSPDCRSATMIGASAILIWASLAVLTASSGAMPPFQMVAIAFAVAAVLASAYGLWRGESLVQHARQPWAAWVVGVGGLFGYHVLVFMALKNAPPLQANLINYLWPLLIVLFSALLPGERLRWWHVAGTLAGLAGTVLILTGGSASISLDADAWPGYLAAFGAAFTWGSYSVLSRRFAHVPTNAVGPFLWVSAALALGCHADGGTHSSARHPVAGGRHHRPTSGPRGRRLFHLGSRR